MKRVLIALLLCSAAACTRKVVRQDPPALPSSAPVASSTPAAANPSPAEPERTAQAEPAGPVDPGPLVAPTVQFEFDSHIIDVPSRERLTRFAERLLTLSPLPPITIAGHADERGTAEYNIQLGQRRADVVAKYLVDSGVAKKSLRTVSYGEERPAVRGRGEEAWSKNRRAEIQLPPGLATRE